MKINYRVVFFIAIALTGFYFMSETMQVKHTGPLPLPYSSFIKEVHGGTVRRVVLEEHVIRGESRSGDSFYVYSVNDPQLINDLLSNGVEVNLLNPINDLYY